MADGDVSAGVLMLGAFVLQTASGSRLLINLKVLDHLEWTVAWQAV